MQVVNLSVEAKTSSQINVVPHCCYQGAFQEVNILTNKAHLVNVKFIYPHTKKSYFTKTIKRGMQFYCNIELQIFKLFVRPNMKPTCLQTLKEIKMTAGPLLVLSSDWIV